MRGQKSLYESLFPVEVLTALESESKRKINTERRNEALACRYYYYAKIHDVRYEKCLERLSEEFYIVQEVIIQYLSERSKFIKELAARKTTVADLRKLYPYLNWN